MAKRPDITIVSSGYTSRETLNTNFTNLQEGFDNTLSLDGSTPNAMNTDLDMNSNDLLNVGTASVDALTLGGTDYATVLDAKVTEATTQATNAASSATSSSSSASEAAASATSAAESAATLSQYSTENIFRTATLLLADSERDYTDTAEGDYFFVTEGDYLYKVAASSATDNHIETAGGLKLYVQPKGEYRYVVEAFGIAEDGDMSSVITALITTAQSDYVTPVYIDLNRKNYTISGASHFNMEANMRVVSEPSGRRPTATITYTTTTTGFTYARQATIPGGLDQSTWWATTIAGFEGIRFIGDTGVKVDKAVEIQSILNFSCHTCEWEGSDGGGMTIGMSAINTLSRWCEFQLYENCSWSQCDVNFQADVSGGTNSMGHSRFRNCYMGLADLSGSGGNGKGFNLVNGVSPYNCVFEFNVFTRNDGAFLYVDSGTVNRCHFQMTFEQRSSGGTFLNLSNSATFRGNTGNVTAFSESIGTFVDDGTTTFAKTSNTSLTFTGMTWTHGSVTPSDAADVPTILLGPDPNQRYPLALQRADIQFSGAVTEGSQLGIIANHFIQDSGSRYEWRIRRIQISVGTTSSGNTNGEWAFDLGKNAWNNNAMQGRTDIVIPDGTGNVTLDLDFKLSAASWYDTPTSVHSVATDGTINNGTGPTDVFMSVWYI